MTRNSTLVVVGTATLDQVKALQEFGVARSKAVMYSKEQAARRLRDLERRNEKTRSPRRKSKEKRTLRSKLLITNIWPRITSLVKKDPTKCWIAVAFFSNGASEQLPLERGSKLVVNMSEKTLKAGLTNPHELDKLIRRGVEVYSNGDLHAKMFVVPGCAIVGSSNASNYSANRLVEAAVEVRDRGTVIACKTFVKSLCQSPAIGPEYLDYLKTLYQPPSFVPTEEDFEPTDSELWVVRVQDIDYDRHDRAAEARGKPRAEDKLSAGPYSVDCFCTSGAIFRRKVAERDSVTQIIVEDGELVAHPPSRVLHVERYKKDDDSKWVMVFVETSDDKGPKNLDTIIWKLSTQHCPNCMILRSIQSEKRITNQRLVKLFSRIWV